MDTAMDRNQALQLEKRIQREVPYVATELTLVRAMTEDGEWRTWAVDIFRRDPKEWLMRVESPSAWEEQKFYFQPPSLN